ncbi:acetolactate decarboxylase [Lactococcus petauri]|uniref:acetolactate decarboxylase n=1 Tax=Lactococcus petauri TaxID=1940789 RepID=UPI0013FE036C|nr:acetolactate decarboxylase [Lactococcus petauri]NHI77221.1 acetolactate decarboxylase [Lactococcus petauri]
MVKSFINKMSAIFQHGSFNTLYGGFYEGTITAGEALKYGQIGIGTLDGADGEVIILDGTAYHGNSENQVRIVKPDETLPYVAVIYHQPFATYKVNGLTMQTLHDLTEKFPTRNTAYSLKMTGHFESVEISSKPAKNTKNYLEILAEQPHFTEKNISGTIVGIWSPKFLEDLYGDGAHLHFLSDDKTFGGHLTEFLSGQITIEVGQVGEMKQEFPQENENFKAMRFE